MLVTSVGHAGFHITTSAGTILCDPWVNPAYFGSWFPFPDNTGLDWKALGDVDYLYVSHLHRDHFDARNLAENVSKDATVLLPDYPVPDLRRELENLGFTKFFTTEDSVKHTLAGANGGPENSIDIMIVALKAPADGPIGDSGLIVDDGETVVFNMNDARPTDIPAIKDAFGRVDVHLLQYSGAIWYPMVYDLPRGSKKRFAEQKRQRGMDRARAYIDQVGATWVVPSAGPPAFLDPELRYLNDESSVENRPFGDGANIFPDQITFLDQMTQAGNGTDKPGQGLLMIPGTVGDFTGATLNALTHPLPDDEVEAIFTHKHEYLNAFAARQEPVLAAERASRAPDDGIPLIGALRQKFEPIMAKSQLICDGIGYPVGLVLGDETVVLDFPARVVREPKEDDGKYRYGFRIAPELVRTVLRDDEPDWVNTIFLSTRFTTWRIGGYNEFLYTFFKCLTDERIVYADGWFAEAHDDDSSVVVGGWEVQRRCPHLKADLSEFGVIEGSTLTCNLHGWKWDLESGRCLTSQGHPLRAAKQDDAPPPNEP